MAELEVLRMGSRGPAVEKWQFFLRGINLYLDEIDGKFGTGTLKATTDFQSVRGLEPDGVVGDKSYGAAMMLGFGASVDPLPGKNTAAWPPAPNFRPLLSDADKHNLFGQFTYVHKPEPGDPEHIQIQGNWQQAHIGKVLVPQLKRISGAEYMWFHKAAAQQLQQLWKDWEAAGLLHLPLTWGGSFNPRFIRGSRTTLSNHTFGTAFDINMAWNGLGAVPALVGQKGSVRELVELANENGFYWGGHFNRKDGMHFEVAQVK